MPECHKCPLNQTGDPRCLSCAGPSEQPNHHGRSHISIEHAPDIPAPTPDSGPPERQHELAEFMHSWLRLRPSIRDYIAYWIAHPHLSASEVARKFHISPQNLHQRLIHAAKKSPCLRSFLRLHMKPVRRLSLRNGQ